jgi:hypothetical protein
MPECALAGYEIPCKGGNQRHHIISRGKARGNKIVRKELDCEELVTWVCAAHNAWTKMADWPKCRSIMLWQKIDEFGYGRMEKKVNGLSWKVQPHELTLDAMLGDRT